MDAGKEAWRWRRRAGVIAAAVVAATVAVVGSAGATGRYTDPTGDSGAAPDITGATVSSTADGQILFRVGVANLPSSGDVQAVLAIDADANPDTGHFESGGTEYLFVVDQSDDSYGFARWTGSEWDWDTPYTTVDVTTASNGVTIGVNRSELGGTNQLNFWTRTMTADGGDGKSDDAPDDGVWNYDLDAGGPSILGVAITMTPRFGPKAGKPFSVKVAGLKVPPEASGLSLPQPDRTTCRATLAGRALRGSGCGWKIPKNARGKKLAVAVTVTYEGSSKTVPFTFRVR
jgi:hypothetical protein